MQNPLADKDSSNMNRNQRRATIFAALLFCCGLLAGILGHRYYAATSVNAKTAEDLRQEYITEMTSKLGLNAAKVTQLGNILDQTKAKYKSVKDSCRPALVKIKQEQVSRVRSILTPAQVPVYDRIIAEREQRAKEQEERNRKEDEKKVAARQAKGAAQ
jgi:hypothetical protein